MPKAILTVGVSGSGKTQWAEQHKEYMNINRDDIRFKCLELGSDWRDYKFSRKNESAVTEEQHRQIEGAAFCGADIVISDTNLNPAIRERLTNVLESLGYTVEVMEFPITLEEAWKRNTYRLNGVSHNIVYQQYRMWLEYKGRKVYSPDDSLPKAIMFDIDGTLADHKGIRSPFTWDKVGEDREKVVIKDMLRGYQTQGYKIVVMSGRDSVCRLLTEEWLQQCGIHGYELYMRPEGDKRKDFVVKEELFWNFVAPHYQVLGVVDDRPSVVRLWHELGIENVICVGNPWMEF